MPQKESFTTENCHDWLCPDLTAYWQLAKKRDTEKVILQGKAGSRRYQFEAIEGYALRYFTGQFTVRQVQDFINQQFSNAVDPDCIAQLLQKLIALGVLENPTLKPLDNSTIDSTPKETVTGLNLKPCVHWIRHPDGYWILRNPESVTFLQVSDSDKAVIERLGKLPLEVIASEYERRKEDLQYLLRLLAATGMLEGTQPAKPLRRKFTPGQLLSFKFPLFNPDPWLTRHVDKIRFIYTPIFNFFLCVFLALSIVINLSQQATIVSTGQQLWATQGASLMLPFALLIMWVVSIHELGHAFTLKHYGGVVPEIGLMFMCLMPGCYTNTTDSYCLVRRRQRALVVAAGVLVQIIIWAIAFWLWNLSNPHTWLHTTSYLLMVAALLTVAVNLNPLSKFDGYYLAVALSGINNLRSRSFGFYASLLKGKFIKERPHVLGILAAYAPLSLVYSLLVFGQLLLWMGDWTLTNLPFTVLVILLLWAIYFYSPDLPAAKEVPSRRSFNQSASTAMTAANSNSPNNRPSLKVVEPKNTPASPPITPTPSVKSSPAASGSSSRWLIVPVVAIGIGCLGLIPISHRVSGEATLDSTPLARQTVTMPISGTVKEILVATNQEVQPGTAIALVESESLNQDISKADIELERAQQAVANATQQLGPLEAQFLEARVKAAASHREAEYIKQQLDQLAKRFYPPEIERLQSQQAGIRSEIAGLKSELALVEQRSQRYETAFRSGAIARNLWEDVQQQRQTLNSQITQKENQIQALEAQIEVVKQELQEKLRRQNAEVDATVAQMQSAMRQVEAAVAEVRSRERVAQKLLFERNRIVSRQDEKVIRASKAGTVVTADLDQLKNRYMEAGATLLQVVDLSQLTVTAQIRPSDAPHVKPGTRVTFRPQGTGLLEFTGTVQAVDIAPVVQSDRAQQPSVTVRVALNQRDNLLRPGLQGYAHIEAEQMRLYQKWQQEFVKLVPIGKFF